MCFSAAASFAAAGVTGLLGAGTLARKRLRSETALAGIPLLFAMQQALEGVIWLVLPTASGGAGAAALGFMYLFVAQCVWPVWAPLAVLLIEPDPRRRRLIMACLVLGVALSAYLMWGLVSQAPQPHLMEGHITYGSGPGDPVLEGLVYLGVTCLPFLFSSRPVLWVMGTIIFVGAATAHIFYLHAFQSVWCFFAALGSIVLLGHFEWARRSAISASS